MVDSLKVIIMYYLMLFANFMSSASFLVLSASSLHYGIYAENTVEKLVILSLVTFMQMQVLVRDTKAFLLKRAATDAAKLFAEFSKSQEEKGDK